MKPRTWPSGKAPMKPSIGCPLSKAITAGNRLDAELAGDLRMIVDVHLDELDLAAGVGDRLFQHRRQLLARAAPRRPEIDKHRLARRGGDDVLPEGRRRHVLDRRSRRAAA